LSDHKNDRDAEQAELDAVVEYLGKLAEMCTSKVALNWDGVPTTAGECNVFQCNHTQELLQEGEGFDPFCKEGTIDYSMKVCCQSDCGGECADTSDTCSNAATNGRGSTCCPSVMLAAKPELPSCDFSKAPCLVPERVRKPTDEDKMEARAQGAIDDCNAVVPETDKDHFLATSYLKMASKQITSATTSQCNSYPTDVATAAACDDMADCFGFTVDAGTETGKCLLLAGTVLEPLTTSGTVDTWLKIKNRDGSTYEFDPSAWTACSLECVGDDDIKGTTTRTLGCKSTLGTSTPLQMCTSKVALNWDGVPTTAGECNVFSCNQTHADNSFLQKRQW